MKKSSIFVCQMEETGEIFAGRQNDVEQEIRTYEDLDQDLPFTTIGKIDEPPSGLPIGFDAGLIEWFDKNKMPDRSTIDKAVLKIVGLLANRR
jgi:hypothetical protein